MNKTLLSILKVNVQMWMELSLQMEAAACYRPECGAAFKLVEFLLESSSHSHIS
jgi:hypothetical protein